MKNKKALFTSQKQDWRTPGYFLDVLKNEFSFGADLVNEQVQKLIKSQTGQDIERNDPKLWCRLAQIKNYSKKYSELLDFLVETAGFFETTPENI